MDIHQAGERGQRHKTELIRICLENLVEQVESNSQGNVNPNEEFANDLKSIIEFCRQI